MRKVPAASGPLRAEFRAPASKSVTHRALVTAALSGGRTTIRRPLDADDTRATAAGLRALGVRVRTGGSDWTVDGVERPPGGGRLVLGESGTSARFLLALSALGRRPSELDGGPRLRRRPMAELARALERLGGRVRLARGGGLPAIAGGGELPSGGRVVVDGRRSSQFASALLLIGCRLPGGVELEIVPGAVSLPYVELTAGVLAAFGVPVRRAGALRWSVPPGAPCEREFRVEGDHSSAGYFLAAAAVVGGTVRVSGLDPASPQPDARLAGILERLGCAVEHGPDSIAVRGRGVIPGFDLDVSASPDLAPTLAVLALFAEGGCRLRGMGHLADKESDRPSVLAENLARLGRTARLEHGELTVPPSSAAVPPARPDPVTVHTASDHRIAMAFAVAGLRRGGIVLDDAACVTKSHPGFWDQFERMTGRPSP